MNSPPQLRRGGAPKGEPDRAKPQSKAAGVVLVNELIFIDQHHLSLGYFLRLRPIGLALRGLGCLLLS